MPWSMSWRGSWGVVHTRLCGQGVHAMVYASTWFKGVVRAALWGRGVSVSGSVSLRGSVEGCPCRGICLSVVPGGYARRMK